MLAARDCSADGIPLLRCPLSGTRRHVVMMPAVSAARQAAERRIRPACACAIRMIRSFTTTPPGAAASQPRRRSAIHDRAGSSLPSGPFPDASAAASAAFQWPSSSPAVIPETSPAHHDTRSATTAAVRASPVFSSVPPRTRTQADAVRDASPAPATPATPDPRITFIFY